MVATEIELVTSLNVNSTEEIEQDESLDESAIEISDEGVTIASNQEKSSIGKEAQGNKLYKSLNFNETADTQRSPEFSEVLNSAIENLEILKSALEKFGVSQKVSSYF